LPILQTAAELDIRPNGTDHIFNLIERNFFALIFEKLERETKLKGFFSLNFSLNLSCGASISDQQMTATGSFE
jgi:hypothetical protein